MSSGVGALHGTAVRRVVDALDGHDTGCVVLVEGEAGIGKTTLLDAVARSRPPRFELLLCAARPNDQMSPFSSVLGPLSAAMRHGQLPDEPAEHLNSLLRLRVEHSRLSPLQAIPDERLRMIDGVATVFDMWSERNPLIVLLDDMHWADDASLAVLDRVSDLTRIQPISLVAASRPLPRSELLATFVARLQESKAMRVQLQPLDRAEIEELLETLFDAPPATEMVTAAEAAGGNPFLLHQLADSWERSGAVHIADGVAELDPDASATVVAGDIYDVVLARMAGFDSELRRALQVGAALGRSFAIADLAAVLRRTPTDVLPVVERAMRTGVLREEDRRLRFQHDLVAEAVLAPLSEGMRAALHRDIADALQASGAPVARVAAHLAAGAERGDVNAVIALREASAEIMSRSPAAAADLLRHAVDLCPLTAPERDAIVADLIDASFWCGRLDAMALADDLLARQVDPSIASRVHETVARTLALSGRPYEAIAHAETLTRDGERSAWSLALTSIFRLFSMDLDGALTDAAAAVDRANGDDWAETLALGVQSFTHVALGYQAKAVEFAAAAVAVADRSPKLEAHRMMPLLFHGLALENACQSTAAQTVLRRGELLADELGTAWSITFFHYAHALAHWGAGRWGDLLAECRAGLNFARHHDVSLAAGFACGVSAIAHLFQRDPDTARQLLDEGDAIVAKGGLQYGLDFLIWVRALLLESEGRDAEALELLRGAAGMAEGLKARAALSLFGPDLVRMAVLAGEVESTQVVLDALERGRGETRENIDAHAMRSRGLVEGNPASIAAAREEHRRFDRPVEALFDDEAEVLCIARRGDLPRARLLLDEFINRCDELGCPGLADRTVRGAARYGVVAPTVRTVRPVTGWRSLTPTEQKVATLVSKGHSNLQIARSLSVSPRTVESHLYRAFIKFGVTNRTELAVAALDAGA